MTLDDDLREDTARQVLALAAKRADDDPVYQWICRLAAAYPGDMGLLAPALLNLIRLEPEQAIFPACRPTACLLERCRRRTDGQFGQCAPGGADPQACGRA